ncbi:sigma-70 family RNA polymerase sigma factor [Sphingomonas sp. ST-64]|uniref:Sigma-70 family RNA polymerase sigma factor n=1 Tax=Sphingomonas plantiphila TaxID=3163295 RepID=A0ABW8YLH4_9SPHN
MRRADETEQARSADELLVIRCQLGERRAFDALIARWADPVANYARRVCQDGDAAAELAQDVWLRVVRGIDRLEDASRFRSWLFGIAHRAFSDLLRRRYRELPSSADDFEQIADEPLADAHADLEQMEHGLARLPPVEREILTLFYLRELTIDETAEALAIPPGTVKSRLHRARRLLRRELEHDGAIA